MMLFAAIIPIFFACGNESNPILPNENPENDEDYSPYSEYADTTSAELIEFLDTIPTVDLSDSDMTLENGNNIIDFISAYDSAFVEENQWIYEFRHSKSERRTRGSSGSNITGNAGVVNLKNTIVSQIIAGSAFFLNDSKGEASNNVIADKIKDHDQKGLWYKWGGKQWDSYTYPSKGGEPTDGVNKMCYGLDCSGLVYSAMNRIGFKVDVLNAAGYYNLDVWNKALKAFIATKKQFSDDIKNNLKFEKYEFTNKELVSKVQAGDILFFGTSGIGHIGIVSTGSNIAQSNGKQHPEHAEDNYYFNKKYRGPHLIPVSNAANYWGISKFGVIRLVATLNNTHWRLKIKCEGRDTYITTFDIEINMQENTKGEIEITPIQTIGYDYGGEPCDVYFTGTFNSETQILKGSVKKTYSASDTRTDGFEIKLTDDNIYNIQEYIIVSNGGCTNYLDLENLDNKESNKSRMRRLKVNDKNSVLEEGDCADHGVYVY